MYYYLFTISSILVSVVFGYHSGAPSSSCSPSSLSSNGITPGHSSISNDIAHLSITITKNDGSNSVVSNLDFSQSYIITLHSSDSNLPFKGFALGAYSGVDGSRLSSSFSSLSTGSVLTCSIGNAITHSDSNLKTTISAVWTSPASLPSSLFFSSTVVDTASGNYYFIKTNMMSTSNSAVTTTPATITTTTTAAATTLKISSSDNVMSFSYLVSGNVVNYSVFGTGVLGWMAVGVNSKNSMTGADVVSFGVASGTGFLVHGTTTASRAFVADSDQSNILLSAIQTPSGTSVNFTRPLSTFSNQIYFIFAYNTMSNDVTQYHTNRFTQAIVGNNNDNSQNNYGPDNTFSLNSVLSVAPVVVTVITVVCGIIVNFLWKNDSFKKYIVHSYFVDMTLGAVLFWGLWLLGWAAFYYYIFTSNDFGVGKSSGSGASMCIGITICPISRTSLWVRVFNVPLDRAIKFHRIFGYTTIFCGLLHALRVIILYGGSINLILSTSTMGDGGRDNYIPLSGLIALIIISVMLLLSFIRRGSWKVFYLLHVSLAICAFVAVLIHTTGGMQYYAPGALIYVVDLFFRYRDSSNEAKIIELSAYHKNVTTLKISLPNHPSFRNAEAGSYAFLCIPEIDYYFHPFSIASPPYEDDLTFYIKNNGKGTWTSKLHDIAVDNSFSTNNPLSIEENSKGQSNAVLKFPKILIWGPQGKLNVTLEKSKLVIMIAGGIGITPFLGSVEGMCLKSIYQDLKKKKEKSMLVKNEKVILVWYTRDNINLVDPILDKRDYTDLGFTALAFNTSNKKLVKSPEIPHLFKKYATEYVLQPHEVSILACGPSRLVSETTKISMMYGFNFHKEVFEL